MGLEKIAKKLAKGSDIDIEEELKLLRQRQKRIELNDYFTAFTMEKIRQDEKKNNKIDN